MKIDIRLAGMEDSGLITGAGRQTFYDTFASQNTAAGKDGLIRLRFTI